MAKKKNNLNIYGLSIINNENKRVLLNSLDEGKSYIDLVEKYIMDNIMLYTKDSSKDTLFQFEHVEKEYVKNEANQVRDGILFGRVKTGEYGIESELVNVNTGQVTNRSKEQADMLPFGFCIAIPSGRVDTGIIILQTSGIYGMKLSLHRHLQKCLTDYNPELNLQLKSIAPKTYIERYFNAGTLKKIRLLRYEIPEDESEKIGINYGVKQTKEERIIHRPVGFLQRKKKELEEWFAGQRSYTNLIEIDGFEYDDIKLEFALGNGNKTLNLREISSVVVSEDITDKVMQVGGNPDYDKLKPVMKQTAEEYLKNMGFLNE